MARAGSEIFQSCRVTATCVALFPGEGRISPNTEIDFPHEPHILRIFSLLPGSFGDFYLTTL